MKYCVNCRKFLSALGPNVAMICIPQQHEIIERSFEELYETSVRKGELAAKGCKLMGICQCHYNTTNCCEKCKK